MALAVTNEMTLTRKGGVAYAQSPVPSKARIWTGALLARGR